MAVPKHVLRKTEYVKRLNIPEGVMRRYLKDNNFTFGDEIANCIAVLQIIGEYDPESEAKLEHFGDFMDYIKDTPSFDYDNAMTTRDEAVYNAFLEKVRSAAVPFYERAQHITPTTETQEGFVDEIIDFLSIEHRDLNGQNQEDFPEYFDPVEIDKRVEGSLTDIGKTRRWGNHWMQDRILEAIQRYVEADFVECQSYCLDKNLLLERNGDENYRINPIDYPELNILFQYSSRKDLTPDNLKSILQQCERDIAVYKNILHSLEHEYGCTVVREDNGLIIENPDLGIGQASIEAQKTDSHGSTTLVSSTKYIERLAKQLQQLRNAQQTRLNTLAKIEDAGFSVEYPAPDRVIVTPPQGHGDAVEFTLHGSRAAIPKSFDKMATGWLAIAKTLPKPAPVTKPSTSAAEPIAIVHEAPDAPIKPRIEPQPRPATTVSSVPPKPLVSPADLLQRLDSIVHIDVRRPMVQKQLPPSIDTVDVNWSSVSTPTAPVSSHIRRATASYLIMDNSVFDTFASPRTGGNSWLDLIHIASRFPTTKAVVIPSVIADFEMRGKMPKTIGGVRQLVTVDESRTKSPAYKATNAFLNKATRVFTDKNGVTTVLHEGDPKIIIWESENQIAFYNYLAARQEAAKQQGISFDSQLKHIREAETKDFGENCMLEFAYSPFCNSSAIFLTNDGVFAHECKMDAIEKDPQKRFAYTSTGHGIGTLSAARFIGSMCHTMGDTLTQLINSAAYGGTEKNMKASRILASIAGTNIDTDNLFVRPDCITGKSYSGSYMARPTSIIESGAAQWMEENPVIGSVTASVVTNQSKHPGKKRK